MSSGVSAPTLICPAKINLTLAILGRRADGFHDLQSVVAQIDFGDELQLEWIPTGPAGRDAAVIEGAVIPEGANSVLAAIQLFREQAGFMEGRLVAHLKKRIPIGAGLGGGSSDAVATLKGLAALFPDLAAGIDLAGLAARIGSDCPLFLSDVPVLMEGRGERVTPLDRTVAGRLSGQEVILFKPRFSINTAEAYRRLAVLGLYTGIDEARYKLREWEESSELLPPVMNDFERLLEHWMPTLPVLLERLRRVHGLDARLSGSGSACFAFPCGDSSASSRVSEEMERAWGRGCWIEEVRLK
jgi:4-diphosphocytidyl-2-C-methyl-D-erythritol kinase